jgi:hypothetical protein
MCKDCWDAESERIDSPAVRRAAELIQIVYEYHPVAGGLHVILDDWNIEDGYLAGGRFPWETDTPGQIAAEEACLEALRALTEEERASALAIYDGYWTPDGYKLPRIALIDDQIIDCS